jgi:eukaryotic-like serine/threonine-protein kinase
MRRALAIACAALDQDQALRLERAREQCGEDRTLRTEVLALLVADYEPERAFERDTRDQAASDPWPGRLVGRFRVGERLGSGGMGTVYRAEPEDGVAHQPVALKLIKRGMDSEEIVRRFLRERGILVRLDHPNIARLIDGGITDDLAQLARIGPVGLIGASVGSDFLETAYCIVIFQTTIDHGQATKL